MSAMGHASRIALVSAIIVAIAGTSPASAATRRKCTDYRIPDGGFACALICKFMESSDAKRASSERRIKYWQDVTANPKVINTKRMDFSPGQVADVASCVDTTPPDNSPYQTCSFKVCLLVEAPYEQHDVNRIIPLQPIPKPKFGPPVERGAGASKAMSPGLLDGDSGFAAAGPAGAGSPVSRPGGAGSVGSATTYSVGTGSSGAFGSPSGGSSGGPRVR